MFQTKVVEKMKTRVSCSVSFPENRVFYDIMWKIIVVQSRPRMPIKYGVCVLRAVYVKATNSHSECVILTAFPLQQCLNERASILLYVHCLSCYYSYTSYLLLIRN